VRDSVDRFHVDKAAVAVACHRHAAEAEDFRRRTVDGDRRADQRLGGNRVGESEARDDGDDPES
jgi:hypothetical protein